VTTSAAEPTEDATTQDTSVRHAGRGLISITAAKLYFIVAGYAVQLALPRLLGGPEQFGLYSTAMSLVSIVTNVLIAATIQTVSKRVSEQPAHAPGILRQGVKLQLLVGGSLAAVALLIAGPLASGPMHDPLLAPLFRISSVVIISYALYAAIVGALNGQQLFAKQATLDMTYTTLRTVGIVGAAALGFGVIGAASGFATAALLVLSTALFLVGTGKRDDTQPFELGSWVRLLAPLWLYQLCLNLMLQIDLSVLKSNVAAIAIAGGEAADIAAKTASHYAGLYRAAQTFAFVPYQLILSVTFVVFPMVSQAVTLGDADATKRYVQGAMRFSLLVLLAIAAPISGAADGVMRIAYPGEYLGGAEALAVLSLGMVAFALFVIGATILSGAGHPGRAAMIAMVSVAIVLAANILLVRSVPIGPRTAMSSAIGTSIGTSFALLAVGVAVYKRFGAFLPLASTIRVLLAAAAAWTAAGVLPSGTAIQAVLALVGGGVAYLAALAVLREITETELKLVRRVIKK
jgi:stage V sporulation protein B